MDVRIIPFSDVEQANDEAHAQMKRTDKFNTHNLLHHQISARIPETLALKHVKPDSYPTEFIHWVSLITSSRGISPGAWHIFELSPSLVALIGEAMKLWTTVGGINKSLSEEVVDRFPRTTKGGVPTDTVFAPGNRWFLRLEYCSVKDSEWVSEPGGLRGCVTSKESMVNMLCSSPRALSAVERYKRNPDSLERIYLLPWDDSMDPRREYRVFCPPLKQTVSAVSQYSWSTRFRVNQASDVPARAERILQGIYDLHKEILKHGEETMESSSKEKLNTEGFVFDVLEHQDGKVQLIELNPFGAISGCGSCLYNWIEDAELLYGQQERLEFRITM
ncbi:hypothetical protein C8J56DRAFT_14297 [Mycena floridula]|nr:hypothetical protein C8J56DRAFT_14297 [Mycena floridula]